MMPDGNIQFQMKAQEDGAIGSHMHPLAAVAMMNEYCSLLLKNHLQRQTEQGVVAATAGMVPT